MLLWPVPSLLLHCFHHVFCSVHQTLMHSVAIFITNLHSWHDKRPGYFEETEQNVDFGPQREKLKCIFRARGEGKTSESCVYVSLFSSPNPITVFFRCCRGGIACCQDQLCVTPQARQAVCGSSFVSQSGRTLPGLSRRALV